MRSVAIRTLTAWSVWAVILVLPGSLVAGMDQAKREAVVKGAGQASESVDSSKDMNRPSQMRSGPSRPSEQSLDEIERKMHSLRGEVQNLKSEILTLGEQISSGFVTGTKLLIVYNNALGGAFKVESIEYKLDGFTIYANNDPAKLEASTELVVFDANVLPGSHTVDVVYTLRGTGYGVFTYMEDYSFDLRNQYHFSTPRGQAVELNVQAVDRGSGENLRDRPSLKFTVR